MKKTIKLLSILLVAFILAGCGENNSKTENIQQEEVVVEKQEVNVESEKEQEAEQENEQDEPELEAEVSHEPLEYKMAKIGTNEIKSTSKSALVSGLGKEDYTDVTYYNLMFVVDLPVSSDYSEYRRIRLINAKTDTEIKITGDIVYDVYNSRVPTDGELQKNKNNGSIPALLTQTDSNSLNTYIVTSLEPISFDDIKVVCDRSFDNRETWEENILEFNSEIEDIDIVREYTFGDALFSHNGNYYIVEGNSYSSGTGDGKKDGYSRKYDIFTLKDISKPYVKYEDMDKFKGISVAFYDGFEKVEFPKNYEPFIEFERKGNDIRLNVGFEMPEAEEDEIKEFLRTYKTALITSDGQFILKNS